MPAKNDIVPSRFDWGVVAASCIASLCGCLLAVELLNRRGTGVGSKRSWVETITCAICLGLIGIWCMHFIGNRAIVLGDGSDNLQLVYSPGFSTLSAALPIIILTIAFALAELQYHSRLHRWIALIVTGICSGLSVVGMHYIGNLGISNYDLHYPPGFFAASFIIAVTDCVTVMALFYTWREAWISHWPRRWLCAAMLAVGITSMHFIASTNCVYRFKHYTEPDAVRSRNIQVIVAGILCAAAAFAVGVFLISSYCRDRLRKQRSKKVMLTCAVFHPDGRLLVTTEGMLPAREITDKYHHRTFNEDFDTAHPVFHWIFRITRNWASVSEFIPKMKSHINALRVDSTEESRPSSSASSTRYESETYKDYSVIFRERFCVAAAYLAASMNLPLTNIGVLFDKIIDTDTLSVTLPVVNRDGDAETALSPNVFGTGQLLFLTRKLDAEHGDKLINSGFRFATIDQVGRNIANTMQIPLSILEGHVADLRRYVDDQPALEKAGTWLGFFAAISKLQGLDVAVKTAYRDQLPDYQILDQEPVQWQATFLNSMRGQKFKTCGLFLQAVMDSTTMEFTNREQNFAAVLYRALASLAEQVPQSWLHKAVFRGKELHAHFSEPLRDRAPTTHLYAFVAITDVNASFEGFTTITPVPVQFFKVRQQCYPGSPNHAVMSQEIHQEFTALLARRVKNEDKGEKSVFHFLKRDNKKANQVGSRRLSAVHPIGEGHSENSLEMDELVDPIDMIRQSSAAIHQIAPTIPDPDDVFGILVNKETHTQTNNKSQCNSGRNNLFDDRDDDMAGVASKGAALPAATFVDDLIEFAKTLGSKALAGRMQ